MIYNQDDEENFLSDRKVGEVNNNLNETRRRGGAYQEEENKTTRLNNEEKESNTFNNIILIIAVVVVIIAVFLLLMVFKEDSKSGNSNKNSTTNKENVSSSQSQNNSSNSLAISSLNDTYNAYSIDIDSVVHVKGGNFYNNNEKIKGDKAYVEYKQISGLKDSNKEEKINEKLKSLVVELYDKNYLSDEDTLFIDIHTKLSVNFNTLSYLVIKTYEYIDGKRKDEKIISYNIRLDNLEEIKFEDLFVENTNIKEMYSKYIKDKVSVFYFDPKSIYIYNDNLEENIIEMSKNYSKIAIYNRYKDSSNIFKSTPTSKKVFSILESTVSEETKDRAFEQGK
ncbi:MAG: hypothetical protein ACI4ON_05340 [Clostridia bacterium]